MKSFFTFTFKVIWGFIIVFFILLFILYGCTYGVEKSLNDYNKKNNPSINIKK